MMVTHWGIFKGKCGLSKQAAVNIQGLGQIAWLQQVTGQLPLAAQMVQIQLEVLGKISMALAG